jgi:hypothetical protein
VTWLLKNWKLVLLVVTGLSAAATIGYFKITAEITAGKLSAAEARLVTKDAAIKTLQEVGAANLAFAVEMKLRAERADAEVSRVSAEKVEQLEKSNKIIWSLQNVPPSPISRVVSCYLEQLYTAEARSDLSSSEGVGGGSSTVGADRLQAACAP